MSTQNINPSSIPTPISAVNSILNTPLHRPEYVRVAEVSGDHSDFIEVVEEGSAPPLTEVTAPRRNRASGRVSLADWANSPLGIMTDPFPETRNSFFDPTILQYETRSNDTGRMPSLSDYVMDLGNPHDNMRFREQFLTSTAVSSAILSSKHLEKEPTLINDSFLKELFSLLSVETELTASGDQLDCTVKLKVTLSNGETLTSDFLSDSISIRDLTND